MSKDKITDLVQVNKAVLTPEAIKCLEGLQSENNYGITAIREDLADVVCFIGRILNRIGSECHKEALEAMEALSLARETIDNLKKP